MINEFKLLDFRTISSDSHVEEPIDDLIARLPEDLQPLSRQFVERDGETMLEIPGLAPISVDFSERAFEAAPGDKEWDREFRNDPTGGRDVPLRVKNIESDGVWGEVIYPNRMLALGAHPSEAYQREMARIYNDFVAETFGDHFDRFAPSPLVSTVNVDDAVAETYRVADLGFHSILLPPIVPWMPYWAREWEPLWSALEEVNLPVNFHVFSGNTAQGVDFGNLFVIPEELVARGRALFKAERTDERLSTTTMCMAAAMSPLMHLIGAGVLDRHPRLKFALVESEAGWLPWALQALDLMQSRRRFGLTNLELQPSEYFHRQGWATFIEDRVAIGMLDYIGVDRLMWSNDWPHDEGTYQESEQIVNRLLGHLPDSTKRKLLHDNAAALYGLDGHKRIDLADSACATA
jgi:predicted TIM-barrel fold metal-dependent hydrolase